jgi:citrate lyase subunit beta/citryl-CoA lyase
MEKALASGADAIIIDLEDAVAVSNKVTARQMTAEFIRRQETAKNLPALFVRVNALDTGFALDDLRAIVTKNLFGVVLPKAEFGSDVATLSKMLRPLELDNGLVIGSTRILPICGETPMSLFHLASFTACDGRLAGMTWGAEDLTTTLGAQTNRNDLGQHTQPFKLARNLVLFSAAAASVAAVDAVYTNFKDIDGLQQECLEAYRDGFVGKLAIHPAQVPIINTVFAPSAVMIEHARKVVDLFETCSDGAVSLEGKMLDKVHLLQAKRLLNIE